MAFLLIALSPLALTAFLSPAVWPWKFAGRRELAELVADHVLGHQHRHELVAVVDAEGQADELRQDRRAPRPGLDDLVAARCRAPSPPSSADSRRRTGLSKPSVPRFALLYLPTRRRRRIMPSVFLLCRVFLPLVRLPQGVTGWRPPEVRPSPPPWGWSIGFIATPRTEGLLAQPAVAAGLADADVLLIGIGDRADRRHAFGAHHAHLARGQAQQRKAGVAADELDIGAGGARQLAALARLHLDIVDDGADRHVPQRHGVARLDVDALARDDLVAGLQALRRQDVGSARRPRI